MSQIVKLGWMSFLYAIMIAAILWGANLFGIGSITECCLAGQWRGGLGLINQCGRRNDSGDRHSCRLLRADFYHPDRCHDGQGDTDHRQGESGRGPGGDQVSRRMKAEG